MNTGLKALHKVFENLFHHDHKLFSCKIHKLFNIKKSINGICMDIGQRRKYSMQPYTYNMNRHLSFISTAIH